MSPTRWTNPPAATATTFGQRRSMGRRTRLTLIDEGSAVKGTPPHIASSSSSSMRAAIAHGWAVGLLAYGAVLVLGFNIWLLRTTAADAFRLPGIVSGVVLAALAVVLLRSAGGWRPGSAWWPAVRAAARRSRDDLRGTGMLLIALVLAGVIVWMLVPLALVVGGLLALAVLAVERHADGADDGADDCADRATDQDLPRGRR